MAPVWHEAPAEGRVRAVVVLLHGLNLDPGRMDGWSAMLRRHGALVMRLPLHGHSGDAAHMREVTADRWRGEFNLAVEHARSEAGQLGVPLHFVGYSLGALVCLEWMSRQPEGARVFDALVLAAPALSVRRYAERAIGLLSALGSRVMLPSRSPRRYRATRGTSIAAYQALFALKATLDGNQFRNANQPTLVLVDSRDELIDSRGISRLIERHRLERWTLTAVDKRGSRGSVGMRHLLVDEEAVGPELWAAIEQAVVRHLGLTAERLDARPSPGLSS